MAFLLALLGPLGDFIVKLLKGMGPPQEVIEAEKAGALGQALEQEKQDNAALTKLAGTGDIAGVVSDPDKLREYERNDPNNLDRPKPGSGLH